MRFRQPASFACSHLYQRRVDATLGGRAHWRSQFSTVSKTGGEVARLQGVAKCSDNQVSVGQEENSNSSITVHHIKASTKNVKAGSLVNTQSDINPSASIADVRAAPVQVLQSFERGGEEQPVDKTVLDVSYEVVDEYSAPAHQV